MACSAILRSVILRCCDSCWVVRVFEVVTCVGLFEQKFVEQAVQRALMRQQQQHAADQPADAASLGQPEVVAARGKRRGREGEDESKQGGARIKHKKS